MQAETSNLDQIGDQKYVFDLTKSNLRARVTDQVSFVLPTWIGQKEYKTVMLKGIVTYLEFNLEDELNLEPRFPKNEFNIHGMKFKAPEPWVKIHKDGCAALKEHLDNQQNNIPGADIPSPPRTLSLAYVHVKIDALDSRNRLTENKNKTPSIRITQKELEEVVAKCQTTGKKVEIIEQEPQLSAAAIAVGAEIHKKDPVFFIISIPIGWIVQDITALQSWNSSHKTDGVLPFIKLPVAFPSIGSRIEFTNENDEDRIGIINDFNIMEDGKTIGALVSLIGEENTYEAVVYSNLFAKSMETLLNPKITRTVAVEDIPNLKKTYLEDGRELIRKALSKWTFFSVSGLRILANEYTGTNEADEPTFKAKWIPPAEAIGNKGLHIVSFVSGEASINGKKHRIVHKEKIDERSKEKIVDISEIPSTKNVNRLIFNAAIGTAEGVVSGKKVQAFFSTVNGVDISTRRIPLFGSVVPTDRVSINVTTFKTVLGYISKGRDKNHPDQKIIMWTLVPDAFRNFYIFVMKQGQHEMFKGKDANDVREMFESDDFPTLIDMYNFILHGFSAANRTRHSKWSKHFSSSLLGFDHDELIEQEDDE